ncbi:MAG: ABC transporter transmembrane domain-containing protein [Planctomycetaceae bacterium]
MTTQATENLPLRRRVAWMAGHWTPYRRTVPVLLVLTLLNAAVVVVYPWLMGRIVEGVERDLSVRYIAEHAALLLALAVLHFGIYFSLQTLRAKLNLCFAFGARTRAFEHLLGMGPTFFRRFRTGDVVTRLIDDVSEKLAWYMGSGIFRVIDAG